MEKRMEIKINNAYKIYKRGKIEVVALRGLTCNFNKGELTVIMGPSGCGKTTLLNMIGGLDRLSSGEIFIEGRDISKLTEKELEKYRRDKIGFVFQFSSLIPELTAEENIVLPIKLSNKMDEDKKNYISKLLELVDLTSRKKHRPDELSGGEQQRIGVAAALANNPSIILCDEPTGELDSVTKIKIMDLLRKVIETYPNKTMIVVTHDPDFKRIADKLYYIRDGRISHEFSKEDLSKETDSGELGEITNNNATIKASGEKMLVELREIDHYIKEKIKKIEQDHNLLIR